MTDLDNVVEYFENDGFLKSDGYQPFYVDPQTHTLCFGYGYDISENWADAISQLQSFGVSQAVLSQLSQIGPSGVENLGDDQSVADQLNGLLTTQDWRPVAQSLMDFILASDKSQLSTQLGINVAGLSDQAQDALTNMAYNGGLASAAFGANLLSDLQSGNIGAAAYEIAWNTALASQNGYENRLIPDAAMMLGFDVSMDPTTGQMTLSGNPDPTAVTQFLADSFERHGYASSFIQSSEGQSLLQQVISYHTNRPNH